MTATDPPPPIDPHSPQGAPRLAPRVIASGALAVAWFTLPLGISVLLLANLEPVTDWLKAQDATGIALATAVFAVASGLGLLPTYAQSIVVGWVFGFSVGLPVAVIGYLGGAIIGFSVSRFTAGSSVQALIDQKPRWRVVREALVDAGALRTIGVVALLRFPPNSPFAFTNLVLAATGVRWYPMIVGSLAGMLPRTALAVWWGAQAAATGAKGLGELVSKQGWPALIVGSALLIVALVVMQQVGQRALRAAGLAVR